MARTPRKGRGTQSPKNERNLTNPSKYVRFADRVELSRNVDLTALEKGGSISDGETINPVPDLELLARFDKVCEGFDCSREELIRLLENNRYGTSVRLGLDRSLVVEEQTIGGQRPKRKRSDLSDPNSSASSEVNRRDKRVVAYIPGKLALEFGKARERKGAASLKQAFHDGLAAWILADRPLPSKSDNSFTSEVMQFQIRVEASDAVALDEAKFDIRGTKRDCVEAVLFHYVNS